MATTADRPDTTGSPAGPTPELEERDVRAADPALSPATNARVTEELREALGTDHVSVPADRPHPSRGEQPPKGNALAYLTQNRLRIISGLFIALTFGGIIALVTDTWWLLPLAAGIHALGTMTVVAVVLGLTTVTEHPSAELAAAMSAEGVSSPDDRFSRMVAEFRPGDPGEGATGVLSPATDERTVSASADPARAGAEQGSAMTPTAEPSASGGEGGTPDFILWATAAGLAILSVVVPLVSGGSYMWLLTAVMLPLLAGWVLLQRLLVNHGDAVRLRSRRPLVLVVACTGVAVAVFCGVVAFAFQH
jgi:hypothetical protein